MHLRPGVHLQLSPVNLIKKIFVRPTPGGAHAPIAPPGYAYVHVIYI